MSLYEHGIFDLRNVAFVAQFIYGNHITVDMPALVVADTTPIFLLILGLVTHGDVL